MRERRFCHLWYCFHVIGGMGQHGDRFDSVSVVQLCYVVGDQQWHSQRFRTVVFIMCFHVMQRFLVQADCPLTAVRPGTGASSVPPSHSWSSWLSCCCRPPLMQRPTFLCCYLAILVHAVVELRIPAIAIRSCLARYCCKAWTSESSSSSLGRSPKLDHLRHESLRVWGRRGVADILTTVNHYCRKSSCTVNLSKFIGKIYKQNHGPGWLDCGLGVMLLCDVCLVCLYVCVCVCFSCTCLSVSE